MKTMPAGEFKAKCLSLMDEVNEQRSEIVITKRGRPVAKIVPAEGGPRDIFGCMQGTATLHGDIVAPAAALSDWEQQV
ncbi:MAG: type II toxin-antitoxin system Phd/YefM family antitoxin [Polyangiaceae bacterium]